MLALGAQWVMFNLAKWVGLVAFDVGRVGSSQPMWHGVEFPSFYLVGAHQVKWLWWVVSKHLGRRCWGTHLGAIVALSTLVVVDDVAILPRFLRLVVSEHVEFT